jgi:hypothetical protein
VERDVRPSERLNGSIILEKIIADVNPWVKNMIEKITEDVNPWLKKETGKRKKER